MTDPTGPVRFPSTIWSVVLSPAQADPEQRRRQMGRLIESYWKPVFLVLRRFHAKSNEEARDLTQEFFLYILERDVLEKFEAGRARFRTFLKAVLRNFLSDEWDRRRAQKRGGGAALASIEAMNAFDPPAPAAAPEEDPDRAFDRGWAATIMEQSVVELRERLVRDGRERCWKVFEAYDLAPSRGEPVPTYDTVASRLGIKETDVRNDLHAARRLLRAIVAERVQETVASSADLEEELRMILGR